MQFSLLTWSILLGRRNEEIDDKSLVKILRRKIAELETEISCLKLQTMVSPDLNP